MKRYIFTIILCLEIIVSFGQITFTSHMAKVSGNELSLTFKATIEDGYHLNTDLVMEHMKGVKPKGELWEVKEGVYEQRLTITDADYAFSGYLEYYACNDMQCLAPASVEFAYNGKLTVTDSNGNDLKNDDRDDIAAHTPDTAKAIEDSGMEDDATAYDMIKRAASPLWTPIITELEQLSKQPTPVKRSLFDVIVICFLGGLLTILTPCVWPIIPLTVSFFIKRAEARERNRAHSTQETDETYSSFAINETMVEATARSIRQYISMPGAKDAMWYGVCIILLFMALGIFMTLLFGVNAMNALSTNAIFNVLCFLLLVAFGFSFLGLFEIRLPSSWANMLNMQSDNRRGKAGMLFMALTLVVVSFSCTAPVLGYLLVEIAVQGDILAPAVGMFAFSAAIATPFAVFAAFPTILKKLPRSGYWMTHIKVTLGFIELAFSLKFLSVADMAYGWGILPRWLFLTLWIVIFTLLALYHTNKLRLRKAGWRRLTLAALSFALVIYLVPGLWGAPCNLVSAFAPPADNGPKTSSGTATEQQGGIPAHYSDYEEGMAAASRIDKPVLLGFTGYGCVNCRKMEGTVWGAPSVRKIINEDYLVIMLYVDDKTPLPQPQKVVINGKERTLRSVGDMWSYLESHKFGAISQPFYVLLTPEGKPLNGSYGYDEDIKKYKEYLQNGLYRFNEL